MPSTPSAHLVAQARRKTGRSQAELARMLGIHQSSLSRLETGCRAASFDELVAIAQALSVPLDGLLGDSEVAVRRHSRGDTRPPVGESAVLAERLREAGALAEFVARGGSLRAIGLARLHRQPLSPRQAVIARSVLAILPADGCGADERGPEG